VHEGCDPAEHQCHYLEPDPSESDHRWDDIITKEKEIQDQMKRRADNLEQHFGDYVDTQPCFPPSREVSNIQIPQYIDMADRISIKSKMYELEASREQAKELACFYRDRFYESKVKIKELETKNSQIEVNHLRQTQKVRYFWRNQVLEEGSRSGRILKMGLTKQPLAK